MKEREPLAAVDLEDAAEILDKDGWCQGKGEDSQGRHCLLNAVSTAHVRRTGQGLNPTEDLTDALDLHGEPTAFADGQPYAHVWNDHPTRTKEQVIDRLMRGAKKLRGQGR